MKSRKNEWEKHARELYHSDTDLHHAHSAMEKQKKKSWGL